MKRNNLQDRIYAVVKNIPRGKVMTYGQIAKKLGLNTPRIVGFYVHKNIDPAHIPCHRVVFHDGSLSKNYAFGGPKEQKRKLIAEGNIFQGEKVQMKA